MPKKQYLLHLYWIIAGVCIYSTSIFHPFTHLDDYEQIVNNTIVNSGNWSGFVDIFSSSVVGMYQPLTTTFFKLIYNLGDGSPVIFHIFSLLLHLINASLIYRLLRQFKNSKTISLLLTGLFVTHIVNVESVAWISASSNLLFTTFYLSGLLSYISVKSKKTKWFLTYLFFLLSCFSKSAAITFPFVIIAYDLFMVGKREILNKVPLVIMSIIFAYITYLSRESAGHLSELSIQFSTFEHVLIVCKNLIFYPITFIIPFKLSAFYPFPDSLNWQHYLAPILILAIVVYGYLKPFSKLIWFAIIYYLMNIALVSQIIPFGQQITADRYHYPVFLAFLLMLSYPLNKIRNKSSSFILAICITLLTIGSFNRSKIWQSDINIWENVIENYPQVAQAYNNLGSYYLENKQSKKALENYNKAIALRADYSDAYSNRGALYGNLNQSQKAIKDLNKAIELKPHADAYFNRANEWMKLKQTSRAISDYQNSIRLKQNPDTYTNLAFAYLQSGELSQGIENLEKAIRLDRNFDRAYYLLGMVYWRSKEQQKACNAMTKASQLGNKQAKQLLQEICS